MAKKIYSSDIYGDRIHAQTLQDTIALANALRDVNNQFVAMARTASSGLSANTSTASGISQVGQSYTLLTAIEKERQKVAEKTIEIEAKLAIALEDETRLLTQKRKELEQVNRAVKTGVEITNESIGSYQKAVNQLNATSKALKDLSVAGKQNTAQFKELQGQYSKLYETVLAADKAVGHFQRNVGNYEMATHRYRYSLFQVQQVMRELPNFAISARVGFMSLSNNLPILADELSKIARSVDENTGKVVGWGKTLRMVGKELLGWQTLLLVGVTLMVQYGETLVDYISTTIGADKATKALTGSLSLQQFEMEKGKDAYIKASSEISIYTEKVKLAKEGKIDEQKVIDEYNKSLGTHIGQVSDLLSLEKQLVDLGPQYIKNMMLKAAVEATAKEQAEKRLELELKIMSKTEELIKMRAELNVGGTPEMSIYGLAKDKYIEAEMIQLARLQGELAKTDNTYSKLIGKLMSRMSGTVDYGDWNWGTEDGKVTGKGSSGGDTGKVIGTTEEKDTRLNDELFKWKIEMERIDEKKRINEINAEVDAARLKLIAKSADEEKDIERELKESLMRIQLRANEEKKKLLTDPNYVGYDSVEQIELLNAEIARLRAEIDLLNKATSTNGEKTEKKVDKISSAKEIQKSIIDIAKAYDQYADSREKMQQTRLQNQINATKRRQEELRLLSAQGVKDAKDNLAMEEKKMAELERRQEVLQRRQQNRQLMLSALQTYNTKAMSGDKNALQNTIKDLSALIAFASTIPAFLEGTEDTGENGQGIDGKGGFHAIIHPNERILKKEHNMMIGGLSNDELADVAFKYRTGMIPMIPVNDDVKSNPVIQELRDLKQAIKEQKPPQMYWNDTDKAMEYKYKQGERMVKEIHKTTGIFSTR